MGAFEYSMVKKSKMISPRKERGKRKGGGQIWKDQLKIMKEGKEEELGKAIIENKKISILDRIQSVL